MTSSHNNERDVPRAAKIYTKTGDRGETGLVGRQRVSKDSPRIWAYGTVDELNASIGLARAFNEEEASAVRRKLDAALLRIQHELFNLGAELSSLPADSGQKLPRIQETQIVALEKLIDELESELAPLKQFILPGGCKTAAALHQARTICRRAERFCVRLAQQQDIGEFVLPYLNRLGDALFVMARWANKARSVKETAWQK